MTLHAASSRLPKSRLFCAIRARRCAACLMTSGSGSLLKPLLFTLCQLQSVGYCLQTCLPKVLSKQPTPVQVFLRSCFLFS